MSEIRMGEQEIIDAQSKKVCAAVTCDNCGRLVCPMRGSPGIIVCSNFVSHTILQRTLRDTPPNEARLRGCKP